MGQVVVVQERREGIPAIRMSLVQPVPVALGVQRDGIGVVFDAVDRAMRDLVVLGEFERARVMGEQQGRSSGEQRRDVAMDPSAEREVVLGQVIEPGLRVQEEPDAVRSNERMVKGDRRPLGGHGIHPLALGVAAVKHQLESLDVLGHVHQTREVLRGVQGNRSHLRHVRRHVQRDRGIGGERLHLLFHVQVRPVHEHRRAADHLDVLIAEAKGIQVIPRPLTPDSD